MDDSVARRFLKLHHKMKSVSFGVLFNNDFNQSEFITLMAMSHILGDCGSGGNLVGQGVSMNSLTKALRVSPPMISKTVGSLERRGLVERIINKTDRREIRVCLTQKGYELFESGKKSVKIFMDGAFEEMGEEELNVFFDLNERLCSIILRRLEEYKNNKTEEGELKHGQNT